MQSSTSRAAATMLAVALFSLTALFSSATMNAQPPQCTPITVKNGTSCFINFCLKPSMGPALCVNLAPFTAGIINVPPGIQFFGVIGFANISYPFIPSPMITAPWWVPNVTLAPGCCCDVYYDPASCSMRIVNTSSPPPCQP